MLEYCLLSPCPCVCVSSCGVGVTDAFEAYKSGIYAEKTDGYVSYLCMDVVILKALVYL